MALAAQTAVVVVFDLNGARSTNVPFGWFLELELVRRITIRILDDRRRVCREVIVRIRLRSALLALALRFRGCVIKVERMLQEDVSIQNRTEHSERTCGLRAATAAAAARRAPRPETCATSASLFCSARRCSYAHTHLRNKLCLA